MLLNSSFNTRLANEPNYRFNCGQYVLHSGDTPVGAVMDEVALAIDRDEGVLHKYGSVEAVTKWADTTRAKLRGGGRVSEEMANSLVVISGRFPLDMLNKCLTNSAYAGVLLKALESGSLAPAPMLGNSSN